MAPVDAPRGLTFTDRVLGLLAAAVALSVYWCTLAPGLIDIRDTPAFQYMGSILGVPHQPGYPFYVLICHLFSLIPFGSLAYRMNLLSAVFGGVSVALLYAVLRGLGCSRLIAFSVSLSAAFAPTTWSQSIIAEVYSLESSLVLATVLAFLRWRTTRSQRMFTLGAFFFGLTVAHHPDEWTLAPALAAFVWYTDRSWLHRPAVMLAAACAVGLAFAPYVLIVVRTMQNAPYVLEPARGIGDLWKIYSGSGYHENLFAFSMGRLVTGRVPLIAGLLWSETGPVPCGLAAFGCASFWRGDRAAGLLLALQWLGQFAFTVNYDGGTVGCRSERSGRPPYRR